VTAHGLVARGRSALLAAKLRLPEGTLTARDKDGGVVLLFATDWFHERVKLDADAARLVAFVHEAPAVRAAVERFAKHLGARAANVEARALAVVEQALRTGVLCVS
jgi:hypothetical protein